MRSVDRTILIGVGLLGLIAAFWFLVLSPKRDEAAKLETEVATLQDAVEAQEQLAAAGEAAEESFDENYESLVVLGKAVPSDSDTSSLFVELNELAGDAGTQLDSIELTTGSGSAVAATPPPPVTETTTDPPEGAPAEAAAEATAPTTPVAATETAAASLPIGATVGPAGLPVMPYDLKLSGSFFELADFLKSVDDLVGFADADPSVSGRLLTIDAFSLKPESSTTGAPIDGTSSSDALAANLSITSYVTPADQGLTAGASPAGPPAAVATTVTSTTTTEPVAP